MISSPTIQIHEYNWRTRNHVTNHMFLSEVVLFLNVCFTVKLSSCRRSHQGSAYPCSVTTMTTQTRGHPITTFSINRFLIKIMNADKNNLIFPLKFNNDFQTLNLYGKNIWMQQRINTIQIVKKKNSVSRISCCHFYQAEFGRPSERKLQWTISIIMKAWVRIIVIF